MAYSLLIHDFGPANANLEVKVWERGTGIPAIILASPTGGFVNNTGQAFLDSLGVLRVYVDTSRTWDFTVYDEIISDAFGTVEKVDADEVASKVGRIGVTYILTTAPYTPYYWNGDQLTPFAGANSVIDPNVVQGSTNAVQGGGVYTALTAKLNVSATTSFTQNLLAAPDVGTFKTALSLDQVDNTSDLSKPVSTAQAAADAAVLSQATNRANHTGTQLVSTISDFQTAVDARVNVVVGAAPGALDTLAEIAAALNDDPDFAATITSQVAGKAPLVHSHVAGDVSGLGNAATKDVGTSAGTVAAGNDSRFDQIAGKLDIAGNGSQLTGLTKAQVGLSNVDNVSDVNKPVSTAQAAADAAVLAASAPIAHVGSGGTAHAVAVSAGASGFMSGTDKAKLDGVAPNATANSTDAALRDRSTHTGTQLAATISDFNTQVGTVAAPLSHVGATGGAHGNAVASGAAGFMTGADKAKLDGVAAGATANSSDATLLNRANHTGTQTAATISDFSEAVDDRVGALLVQGSNITLTYNDAGNSLTIAATATGVTDHGALTGLSDDDHTQYHTDARGDARYAPVAHVGSGGTAHANVVAGGSAGFMTGSDKTKLDGIATGATANPSDATLLSRSNHTGTQTASTISDFSSAVGAIAAPIAHVGSGGTAHANVVAGGAAGFMTGSDKTKLDGVATGATANSSDATLLDRANHTGTQTASTISDLSEAVDDRVGALLVAGSNVTLTYNDGANTLTIAAAGGGGGGESPSYGSVDLDFGSFPGLNVASVAITGLTTIASGAKLRVWVLPESTTTNHTANDHLYFPMFASVSAGGVIAGTGFSIYGVSAHKLQGKFKIQYSWVN